MPFLQLGSFDLLENAHHPFNGIAVEVVRRFGKPMILLGELAITN
ncbi:hypothetical protein [Bradyrhizobium sp. 200]|nr:hypothetical protein [Bradyrhizobium sp. 200]